MDISAGMSATNAPATPLPIEIGSFPPTLLNRCTFRIITDLTPTSWLARIGILNTTTALAAAASARLTTGPVIRIPSLLANNIFVSF